MASAPPATAGNQTDQTSVAAAATSRAKDLIVSYSTRTWRSLLGVLSSSSSPDSRFRLRKRRRKPGLPLLLHLNAAASDLIAEETSRAYVVLQDIVDHILSNLRLVEKSLQFWQSRAEGSNARKIYYMIFERGPLSFFSGTFQVLSRGVSDGSMVKHLCHSAAGTIAEKISVLTSLQRCLAMFLAEIYLEVSKFAGELPVDSERSLPSLLIAISDLFVRLENSISHPRDIYKTGNSYLVDGADSCALLFEKLPPINQERSQWTDTEIRDATNLIYLNLQRLDSYLSFVLSSCQKPGRLTLYWLHYTCGAAGLSVCSLWLLRHSSLMGSSDIDNWICEAKESTAAFWEDHVEQPILSIRDELFETFKRRHKGVMEVEEVQLTANSLHRMLLSFTEEAKGRKPLEDTEDQKMLEIVMSRYEEEVTRPIKNLLSGNLAQALLIQIQKLKLDLETAMLELDQILKANEINFAILAALPAFFLSFLLLMLVRTWLSQDKSAEGRGRIARLQRRLLVIEVEKRIMHWQSFSDQGLEEDARCMFGLVLYSLDRLYKAVESHAKETGEWLSLREDITDLARPDMKPAHKLSIVSRMANMYDCLLPSTKQR